MGKNGSFLRAYKKLREKPVSFITGGWKEGSFMDQNPQAMTGLLGMGSSLVDTIDPGDEWGYRSDAGAIGSGALKGAAAGAALGPLGMAGGALIGGVTGLIGNNKQQAEAERAKFAHQSAMRMDARNYSDMSSFHKKGGKRIPPMVMVPLGNGSFKSYSTLDTNMPSEFLSGGKARQISDTTVEFKGNDPGATDAIQLDPSTHVDHNEALVDLGGTEIIASDNVFLGGGKRSVASQVKKLQMRKNKVRSPKKRALYDFKTDVKLAQQELEAGRVDPRAVLAIAEPGGESMRHGGIGDLDPNFHPDLAKTIQLEMGGQSLNNNILQRVQDYCSGGKKKRYDDGGKIDELAESPNENREEQLEMGIAAEAGEHHKNLKEAKKIAEDHLKEDKNYYTKLKKAGLADGGLLGIGRPSRYQGLGDRAGIITRGELEAFQADPTSIPALRGNINDAAWGNLLNEFNNPNINALEMRATQGGDQVGTRYYTAPEELGIPTSPQMGTGAALPATLEPINMKQSRKVNAYKYDIPRSKDFQEGLKKMTGYAEGGKKGYNSGQYLDSLSNQYAIQATELPFESQDLSLDSLSNAYPITGNTIERQGAFMPQSISLGQKPAGATAPGRLNGWPTMPQMDRLQGRPIGNGYVPSFAQQSPSSQLTAGTGLPAWETWQADQIRQSNQDFQKPGPAVPAVPPVNVGATTNNPGTGGTPGGGGQSAPPTVNRVPVPKALSPVLPQGVSGAALPKTLNPVDIPESIPGVNAPENNRLLHDFAKGAAVFGPDLLNAVNYMTTPRVPSPQKNRYTKLKRMNNRAQMAQIAEAGRSANKAILGQGSQLGATMAGINANQATKIQGINQANENLRNMNAQIGNQEAAMNQRVGMMNTAIENQFRQDQFGRQLGIRKGLAGVSASLGNKGQALFAEKDKKAMDKLAIQAMEKGFPTGVWQRAYTDLLEKSNKQRGIN